MAEEPEDTQEQEATTGGDGTAKAAQEPQSNAADSAGDRPAPGAGGSAAPLVKADLGKRFIAAIIDAVIAVLVGFIPIIGGLIATAYWLVRDGLDIDFMDHRSIGKKLVKLRPVTLDGSPIDVMTSIKRNWMFALGGIAQLFAYTLIGLVIAIPLAMLVFLIAIIEVIMVLVDNDGRRLGDKIADTMVIEVDE